MENTYVADFGAFSDEPIEDSLLGFVDGWGEGDANFGGKVHIEIDYGLSFMEIVEVAVFGMVTCTSAAVLLNSSSPVWFYHVPDTVDPSFVGMKATLALLKLPPNGITKYSEICLVQQY